MKSSCWNVTRLVLDGKPILWLLLCRKIRRVMFKHLFWISYGAFGQLCPIMEEKLLNLLICLDISPSKSYKTRKRFKTSFKKLLTFWNRRTRFYPCIPIPIFTAAFPNWLNSTAIIWKGNTYYIILAVYWKHSWNPPVN